MGKKIEMKKIEDNTKCQVTFSKRRTSLIKKAKEISVSCDVDVAVLAFSPAGRISKFCNRERMEDLFNRYVNLPAEKRLSHIKNVQDKMEKLQKLGVVRNEDVKLYHLDDQIENLELQMKKNQTEVQFAEANLRDFELNQDQEASLRQLLWCERNLQQLIEKVKEKKKGNMVMENEGGMPWLYNCDGISPHSHGSRFRNWQHQMQFESWRNHPYFYPENVYNEMVQKGKGKEVAYSYGASETTMQNKTLNASIPTSLAMHQFGGPIVPETLTGLSFNSLRNNTYNAQIPSSYAINQPGIAIATKTPNELTYAPSKLNLNHGYPQQYSQKYASHMDYQSWKQAPKPWQQVESNSSVRNFAGESNNFTQSFMSAFPKSSCNHGTTTLADASNYWETSVLPNRPNIAHNDIDIDLNEEGKDNNNNNENDDTYNEMIVSPPPSGQAPLSTSGVSSDLYDFFPLEDPPGDNTRWTQKNQDTHKCYWGNLKF